MTPNTKGRIAYRRGYEAARQGQDCDRNPYAYVGAGHGGIGLTAWWTTGFNDQRSGQPQRFTTRTSP